MVNASELDFARSFQRYPKYGQVGYLWKDLAQFSSAHWPCVTRILSQKLWPYLIFGQSPIFVLNPLGVLPLVRPILWLSRNKEVLLLVIRKSGRLKTGNREVCYMKIRRMQSMEYKWCPRQTAESAVRGVYLSTTSEIHKNRNHCFKDFVFSIHLETQKHNWCLVSQVQQYWTVLNRPMFYADVRAKAWSND